MSRAPVDRESRATRRIPSSLGPSLDDAFASEIATRLPRMLAAAHRITDADPAVAAAAVAVLRTDVHTLASSSVVVGAEAAARTGRECEWLLLPYDDGALPTDVATKAAALARGMGRALRRWVRG